MSASPVASAAHVPTVNVPLAQPGASLAPNTEPSEPFARLARIVRETTPSARVIEITSPMSGEGKTTVAVNLAASLAAIGDRVLLVDAHPERLRAHLLLGLTPMPTSTRAALRAYIAPTGLANLDILSFSGSGARTKNPIATVRRRLSEGYDWTLVDTPGGISRESAEGARGARGDLSILVVRTDHTPPRLTEIACERLRPSPTIVVMNASNDSREAAPESIAPAAAPTGPALASPDSTNGPEPELPEGPSEPIESEPEPVAPKRIASDPNPEREPSDL